MTKALTTIVVVACLVALVACSMDDGLLCEEEASGAVVRLRVVLPTDTVMPLYQVVTRCEAGAATTNNNNTRASASAFLVRYIVESHKGNAYGYSAEILQRDTLLTTLDDEAPTLDMSLPAGTYRLLAWRDCIPEDNGGEDYFYDCSTLYGISLTDVSAGDTDNKQAFRGALSVTLSEDDCSGDSLACYDRQETLEMEWATARFTLIQSTETIRERPMYLAVVHSGTTYAVRSTAYGYATNSSYRLTYDYVLCSGDEEETVKVSLYAYDASLSLMSSTTVSVPVVRGQHTIVKGDFLDPDSSSGFGISAEMYGDYNVEVN